MLKSENSNIKNSLRTVWTLMQSAGLLIILLVNAILILLENTVRYKVWAWHSKRKFRAILEKNRLPSDLIEVLVGEYEENIRKVGVMNNLLRSLGGVVLSTGKLRNNR